MLAPTEWQNSLTVGENMWQGWNLVHRRCWSGQPWKRR